MLCPACNEEGQAITCIAGSSESKIVFHPKKRVRNVCTIATNRRRIDESHEDQTDSAAGDQEEGTEKS